MPGLKPDPKSRLLYVRELPRRIQHVTIFVHDLPKAIAWYRDVLGLPLRLADAKWAEFNTDGVTLILRPKDPRQPSGGRTGVTFSIHDLGSCLTILQTRGVKVIRGPEAVLANVRIAEIEDLEGNWITLAGR
ncbi:MAG: VOC family protein [Planctomycetota bacterium]